MNILKKLSALLLCLCLTLVSILGTAGCAAKAESRPLVLLTDFGSADYRVSQLKGIIYSAYPEVRLVEATEDVPAFDIATGAFILNVAAREFPAQTVFVGIVSPYAQAEVRYLVVTTAKGQVFVVPDNGLLTYVLRETGAASVYRITNQSLFGAPVAELSAEQIGGRAGALLAAGRARPQDFGPALASPVLLAAQAASVNGNKLLGAVLFVDNFGNCITNISGDMAREFGLKTGDAIQIKAGEAAVPATVGTTYGDVPRGKEVVFVSDTHDRLQLSINLGSFAKTYSLKAGANIEIQK